MRCANVEGIMGQLRDSTADLEKQRLEWEVESQRQAELRRVQPDLPEPSPGGPDPQLSALLLSTLRAGVEQLERTVCTGPASGQAGVAMEADDAYNGQLLSGGQWKQICKRYRAQRNAAVDERDRLQRELDRSTALLARSEGPRVADATRLAAPPASVPLPAPGPAPDGPNPAHG